MKTLLGTAILLAAAISADAATLQATAGLGGVAKPGRWTLLSVSLDSTGDALDADLDVVWGDVHLRRPVSLAPGVRKTFELYLRTRDARGTIDVRLVSDGRVLASTAAPVRVLAPDDPVTICALPDASAGETAGCTAFTLAQALPRSARGYEVADAVVWPAGRTALSAEQDTALRSWQSLKALDGSGDLALTPQVSRPVVRRGLPASLTPFVAGASVAYLAGIVAIGAALGVRRARVVHVSAGLAAVTIVACAAAAAIGRLGPTRAVHLQHVSLLQQLPGSSESLLTIRGVAEFPAFDRFSLRLPVADGSLETTAAAGVDSISDADGFPVVNGVFGMAGREAFAGEALITARILSVRADARQVRVTNESTGTLRDCRFPRGFSPDRIAALEPGASATASSVATTAGGGAAESAAPLGPVVMCTMQDAPVLFTEANRPVVMHGRTLVAAYRTPRAGGVAGD